MPMNAVDVENLHFAYEETPVLEGVSAHIEPGQFIAIVGPNGGGKTTFLKLLMGMLQPNSGSVRLFGEQPEASLGRIGYVPQILRFDRHFPISVLELVLQGRLSKLSWLGRFHPADVEAAEAALHAVGLCDLRHRALGTLSGGQAQRALIARALASNPDLLLLDEPTANIDAQAQREILGLLRNFSSGRTIVMITHDLSVITDTTSKVFYINRTLKTMTPQEVCGHFSMGVFH